MSCGVQLRPRNVQLKRLKSMVCNSAELQLSCAELRLSCGSILGAFWTDLKEDAAAEAGSNSSFSAGKTTENEKLAKAHEPVEYMTSLGKCTNQLQH